MRLSDYEESFMRVHGVPPRVGFLGLGVSNLAILRDTHTKRIVLRSRDRIDVDKIPASITPEAIYEGDAALMGIYEDILVLSPSVRRDKPELIRARERGTYITSDAELFFFDLKRDSYAVTGSDGKSTTSALIHLLLSERYPDAELLGNGGVPFALSATLGPVVAELSSFQLSYMKPRTKCAVITSISENHLDWHKSFDEYAEAKLGILENATVRVVSPDTEWMREHIRLARPTVIYSVKYTAAELYRMYPRADGYVTATPENILLDGRILLPVSDIRRREWYNLHNLMGAIGATLGECSEDHIRRVAREFPGLCERLEHFHSSFGVDFISSSIDTSPARMAASLTALGRRVRLIMGGRGKGLSLSPYAPVLRKYPKSISLYGEVAKEYLSELSELGITRATPCRAFSRLAEAIEDATAGLCPGDTVLLSPAATGYGEFRSFVERGLYFKDYIRKKYV